MDNEESKTIATTTTTTSTTTIIDLPAIDLNRSDEGMYLNLRIDFGGIWKVSIYCPDIYLLLKVAISNKYIKLYYIVYVVARICVSAVPSSSESR